MKVNLLVLLFCLVPCCLLAKQQTTVGCFSAGKTNLKFVEISSGDIFLGYVIYEKSSKFIPLAFINKLEVTFDDRPSEFSYAWSEVVNGKINGLYVVSTQGARFNLFHYKSISGKTTEFEENIEAYNDDGTDCKWTG
ncbi:hypothetical protein KYK43_004702 [Escherichia coli]|uniref:Uncharacterized protein n=1 Tax=Escherichia coli TaxID=562 RepID=A0A0L7AH90_ECOLX|nr:MULTISPECIES: hypothetical protein [Escherichia]EHQ5529337.1 hypothetical protein [Escherichia coli O2]EFB5172150.1 hypothetical protein [Escherichia coli]EGB61401.1 hypothetical protein ERJG_02706 [Escherichia coli M863]EGE62614.1 hypothetical protein ECSTEC7V_4251 [Escherichia coli STEC_7v]EGO6591554.1 hypothetical protein [Escherichia coli]